MISQTEILTDKFGRQINYLRLSVTDRCNLRCVYCMPAVGVKFSNKQELLTYEEMLYLIDILGEMGVDKIRLTGGEPFMRKDFIHFLEQVSKRDFLKSIGITSNLTLIQPYITRLKDMAISKINVSLDAMDAVSFKSITRRDDFDTVYQNLMNLIEEGFDLKINCVVMKGRNESQILPLMQLAKEHNISVRFLEEMPFNGSGMQNETITYQQIIGFISQHFTIEKQLDPKHSTSQNYRIKGFKGSIGIIPSFSRTFCGDCNRLRVSATGQVRNCLYNKDQLQLREVLRSNAYKNVIKEQIRSVVNQKPKDGFAAADQNNHYESMLKLGG